MLDSATRLEALGDIDTLGAVLRDVLRADIGRTGVGRWPALDETSGARRLRAMLGEDYTTIPFGVALRSLAADPSIPGVEPARLTELLSGIGTGPSDDEIEAAAVAYGKHPLYFSEYRARVLARLIEDHLERSPEASIRWVNQLGLGAA